MDVRPFTIAVEDSVLEDLRKRLTNTRWPDEMPNTGWDYGSNLDYIKVRARSYKNESESFQEYLINLSVEDWEKQSSCHERLVIV